MARKSKGNALDPVVRKKLDGRLRRLLEASPEDLKRQLEREVRGKRGPGKKARDDRRASILDALAAFSKERAVSMKPPGLVFDPSLLGKLLPHLLRVRVLARFGGNRADLESLGLEVRTQAQDIFTLEGTLHQIKQLALQPATFSVEFPDPVDPTVEEAAEQGEVHDVHAPRPTNPAGYRGNGVIVGITDGPLDVTHLTFRETGGANATRVLYYWVMDPQILDAAGAPADPAGVVPGLSPDAFHAANPASPDFTGLTDGVLYTAADIDAALAGGTTYGDGANQICLEPRVEEHGTHVAGIACGNGEDGSGVVTHVGAAPESDIVMVSTRSWNTGNLIDAFNFIFAVGNFLGRPVVVNTSQGGNWGSHTGESTTCQARDNLVNSFDERVLTQAAGNDNNDLGFRTGTIAAGGDDDFTVTSTDPADPRNIGVVVWYRDPELRFRVGIGGAWCLWQNPGDDWDGALSGYDIDATRESEGDWIGIKVKVEDAEQGDPLEVELENPGASPVVYYAWTCSSGNRADLSGATQDAYTTGDSATSRAVLTVGSCDKLALPNPTLGEPISSFSGAGPTVDGRIKPEIVATGRGIMSANSDKVSGWIDKLDPRRKGVAWARTE